jgi:hypothetical protein
MVGIVGILLLGSLAWSAIGALASAVGAAGSAFTSAVTPHSASTLGPVAAVTPSAIAIAALTLEPTAPPTPVVTATVGPTATNEVVATPTAAVAARNPWILQPQPEPGTKVTTGQVVVEARARGDVAIKAIRLELDGAALPAALEQRSESTWRASANTRVAPGQHDVRALVTDVEGRTGSFKWTFTAAPAP